MSTPAKPTGRSSPAQPCLKDLNAAAEPVLVTVPYQDRPLEPPSRQRIRNLQRHLVESLRDLRVARHPERLIQPPEPKHPAEITAVLQAGCAACRGHCCLGGGEHAYLDERTMARVRRDQPDLDARAIIYAYLRQIAPLSYQGSCLFHGQAGCTLAPDLRSTLCSSYYCDGLKDFLRHPADPAHVTIRAAARSPQAKRSIGRRPPAKSDR